MSYDIYLNDPVTRETIILEEVHQMKGGTYAAGGTKEARLNVIYNHNVTYNYSDWYYMDGVFPNTNGKIKGIRTIYGMSGAESIPVLKRSIAVLERCTENITDEERKACEKDGATGYWMPTRENAIRPLYQLLAFAQMRPDGVWDVN